MEYRAKTEGTRLTLYHLAELFFHGEKELDFISAEETDGGIRVSIQTKNGTFSETAPLMLSLHKEVTRAKNAALGKAFSLAAKRITDYTPPYGTLFGVRPVKLPLFYLRQQMEKKDVLSLLEEEFSVSPEKALLLTKLAEQELSIAEKLSKNDGMLYVSIPFCPTRCSYCSFISSSAPKHLAEIPRYLDLMAEEIRKVAALFREKKKKLRAIYVGGGTPGILTEKELESLVLQLQREFSSEDLKEFCVEIGRPDTVTEEKLHILKEAGVGRISINPQTTCDETLRRIGRRHSAEDYFKAMEIAKKYAFDSVNCDLIAGLEREAPDKFLRSVKNVLTFAPENLTIHALCQKRAAEKKADHVYAHAFREAMDTAFDLCEKASLSPYYLYRQKNAVADLENLGFAQRGKECLYNVAMMEDLCDVFAVGAGAISKIVPREKGGKILRFAAYKYPYEYLSDPTKTDENLGRMRDIL